MLKTNPHRGLSHQSMKSIQTRQARVYQLLSEVTNSRIQRDVDAYGYISADTLTSYNRRHHKIHDLFFAEMNFAGMLQVHDQELSAMFAGTVLSKERSN